MKISELKPLERNPFKRMKKLDPDLVIKKNGTELPN